MHEVVLNGGSAIDLGGGVLTAESLRTSVADGGRGDVVEGETSARIFVKVVIDESPEVNRRVQAVLRYLAAESVAA